MIQTQFSVKCTVGEFFLVTQDLLESVETLVPYCCEFQIGRESGRGAFVKWRHCGGIENIYACSWSNSDPNLLLFDPEIERTLRRARQVRRRIEFENNLRSQTENLASENNSAYSSDSAFDCDILSSSDTGTSNMGDLPRIILKQISQFDFQS
ncbi:hypothetical protein PIB30_079599 [Stylosanthes scabra]|uniref:Uncharacterized protein n=1 Tax=Stylosanthes scabra TaxID=79078 RepID=A0ABU6ZPY3_9FABA|nr:hypothetical protein [Stylosanthes scabra]